MTPKADHLIWIDLEMTGLDTDHDYILEIAAVITDAQLNVLAESPVIAIHQCEENLERMDEWNVKQHTASGLLERVNQSTINEAQAEKTMLEFFMPYVPPKKSPMCGSSICQDRRFLHRHMPHVERYFHYRHIDVSTLKELAARWYPHLLTQLKRNSQHRALADIHDSINELRFYREQMFLPTSTHQDAQKV